MTDTLRRGPTGHRVGECHGRAVLSDEDIPLIRELHEPPNNLGYGTLAKKFDAPKSTIRDICKYITRY